MRKGATELPRSDGERTWYHLSGARTVGPPGRPSSCPESLCGGLIRAHGPQSEPPSPAAPRSASTCFHPLTGVPRSSARSGTKNYLPRAGHGQWEPPTAKPVDHLLRNGDPGAPRAPGPPATVPARGPRSYRRCGVLTGAWSAAAGAPKGVGCCWRDPWWQQRRNRGTRLGARTLGVSPVQLCRVPGAKQSERPRSPMRPEGIAAVFPRRGGGSLRAPREISGSWSEGRREEKAAPGLGVRKSASIKHRRPAPVLHASNRASLSRPLRNSHDSQSPSSQEGVILEVKGNRSWLCPPRRLYLRSSRPSSRSAQVAEHERGATLCVCRPSEQLSGDAAGSQRPRADSPPCPASSAPASARANESSNNGVPSPFKRLSSSPGASTKRASSEPMQIHLLSPPSLHSSLTILLSRASGSVLGVSSPP